MTARQFKIPVLDVMDGKPVALSTYVANDFGKPHYDVLRSIRRILKDVPEVEHLGYFVETVVSRDHDGTLVLDPAFRMTYEGFTLLTAGLSGRKALHSKLAYIRAFTAWENALPRESSDKIIHIRVLDNPLVQLASVTQTPKATCPL